MPAIQLRQTDKGGHVLLEWNAIPTARAWFLGSMGGREGKDAAGAGMLRAIACGTEINMAYPPRHSDPAIAWEPDWNVKIRVKSMTTAMMGQEGAGLGAGDGSDLQDMSDAPDPASAGEDAPPAPEPRKKKFGIFDALKEAAKEVVP